MSGKAKRSLHKFTGIVEKEPVMKGSKSEHNAHVLKTDNNTFKLRTPGGNPFHETVFDDYLGKKVTVEGIRKISYLQVHDIKVHGS